MPISAFKTKNNGISPSEYTPKTMVTRATFNVNMRVGSAELDLDLMYEDKSYGKASIEY
jgi:hypothetical protein